MEEQKTECSKLQIRVKLLQTKMDSDTKKSQIEMAKLQAQLKDRAGGTKRKVCEHMEGGERERGRGREREREGEREGEG